MTSNLMDESGAEQRTRQAGWTSAAVDADLASRKCADVKSCGAKSLVRLLIFFNRQHSLFPEG